MNFDGIDAALAPEARAPFLYPEAVGVLSPADFEQAARLGKEPLPPTLQEALAQIPSCGCTRSSSSAGPTMPLLQASVAFEALLPEHEREYSRTAALGDRVNRTPEIVAALSADSIALSDSSLSKEVGPQATSLDGGGGGTTWVDSNGNGYWDPEDEIIVTGDSGRKVDDGSGWGWNLTDGDLGGGDGTGTGTGGGAGGEVPAPTPPDMECLTEEEKSQLSPEEREKYEVAEEAAEIAREIMQMTDRDTHEYGSLIYRDANGVITHTPISRGTATMVTHMNVEDLPSYGNIIAVVHSHPAITYGADAYGNYDFKLYPTPGSHGDWAAFDWYAQTAYEALINLGYTHEQAVAHRATMHQYIVGPKDVAGTGQYEVRKYEADDRDTTTLGQKVPLTLGQCSSQ